MADIFDKMFAGASTLGENSKLLTEKATTKAELEKVKTKRIEVACQLGMMVYNKIAAGELSADIYGEFYPKMLECDEKMDALEKRLVDIENEYQSIQQQHIPKPQPVYVVPVQYVTPEQVAPQQASAVSETVEHDVKYCPSCGSANTKTSKFCTKCGNPFN